MIMFKGGISMIDGVSQDNFYEYIQTNENVIAYFFTPQCGACRMQSPVLEQIAQIFQNKIKIAKIDASQNPNLANSYQINAVPTMIFFKKGKKVRFKSRGNRVDRLLGARDLRSLQGVVQYLIDMRI